jgi:hypothetical protein
VQVKPRVSYSLRLQSFSPQTLIDRWPVPLDIWLPKASHTNPDNLAHGTCKFTDPLVLFQDPDKVPDLCVNKLFPT